MAAPPTNPLHLYRSLLREATYLFDSHSRAILPRYIRSAFESHRVVSQPPRLNSYLKLGRRKHSLLVRANAGDVKALAKVLRFAYGRTGKRARELLEPFTTKDVNPPLIPTRPDTSTPKILPQLSVLASVQQDRVKHLTPNLPKTNIYGKPFPKAREVNLRWKTYTKALKKLLPPALEDEYARLEKLVTGELDEPVQPRRKRPDNEGTRDQGEVARERILAEVDGHNVVKQFKRRLYARVLAEAPRLYTREKGGADGPSEGRKEEVWAAELWRGKQPVEGLLEEFEGAEA